MHYSGSLLGKQTVPTEAKLNLLVPLLDQLGISCVSVILRGQSGQDMEIGGHWRLCLSD